MDDQLKAELSSIFDDKLKAFEANDIERGKAIFG